MIENFLPGNRYTEELCRELSKIADVDLVCRTDSGEVQCGATIKKILDYSRPSKLGFYKNCLVSLFRVIKETTQKKYDIIHVQGTMLPQIEFPVYVLLKNNSRKLVYTVHNILPHEAKESDKKRNLRFYKKCDMLVVHNNWTKKILVEEYGIQQDNICVMPHGTYNVQKKSDTKNESNKKTFLMFGMIRKYKGIDVLFRAIARLPEEVRKDTLFVVAGVQKENLDNTSYERMIEELHISDCTRFINRRIEDQELPDLFAKTDACVFPYKEIYGSGALLMAYSYEKPVIASDVPVFVEETNKGETGILFKSENPESLAQALIYFCQASNAEVKRYVDNIKKLVNQKYNWEKSASVLLNMYKRITLK